MNWGTSSLLSCAIMSQNAPESRLGVPFSSASLNFLKLLCEMVTSCGSRWVQLQIIRVEDWDRIGELYPREMQYCRDQVKSHVRQAQYYKSSEAPPAATAKPTPSPTRAADMMAAASSETDWM